MGVVGFVGPPKLTTNVNVVAAPSRREACISSAPSARAQELGVVDALNAISEAVSSLTFVVTVEEIHPV